MNRIMRANAGVVFSAAIIAAVTTHCSDEASTDPDQNTGSRITVTTAAAEVAEPLDAAPDPAGKQIFFTAKDGAGMAVFKVPFLGGDASVVASGAPLVEPRGIASSGDGEVAYVADPGAAGNGALFAVTIATGEVTPIEGSEGTRPGALDVVTTEGVDTLYYAGRSAGEPAVLRLPALGGTATVIAKGSPLIEPDGVAVALDGSVYVTDRMAGKGQGGVLRLAEGAVAAFGPPLIAGDPAGTALTYDGTALLVSSLSAAGDSQVTILSADGSLTTFSDIIGPNRRSGGLHRAQLRDYYAWAGRTTIYGVRIAPIAGSTPGGPGD